MKEQYNKELDSLEVPPELLKKTAARMREADMQAPEKAIPQEALPPVLTLKPKGKRVAFVGTIAALAASLVIVFFSRPTSLAKKILTTLPPEEHIAQVELVNGDLTFHTDNSQAIELPPRLGELLPKKEVPPEQYATYFPSDDFPFSSIPKDYTVTNQTLVIESRLDDTFYAATFTQTIKGTQAEVLLTAYQKQATPPPTIKTNSMIEHQPLYLQWEEDSGIYTAEWIQEETRYMVQSDQLSQQGFIELLLFFFI